jgi:hypothetical protein
LYRRNIQVRLSSQGLSNIRRDEYENDFTFCVGSKRYECPTFIAEFLSPLVSRLRHVDPTIRFFQVHRNDPDCQFAAFLSLGYGSMLNVSRDNREALEWFCCTLRNQELFNCISNHFDGDLTVNNVVARLRFLTACECELTREVEFAAMNFPEVQQSLLALVTSEFPDDSEDDSLDLRISILQQILGHESLRLTSEDSLCEVVLQCRNSVAFPYLLEYLKFEYLSEPSIVALYECIEEQFDCLTRSIWMGFRSRLVSPLSGRGKHARDDRRHYRLCTDAIFRNHRLLDAETQGKCSRLWRRDRDVIMSQRVLEKSEDSSRSRYQRTFLDG